MRKPKVTGWASQKEASAVHLENDHGNHSVFMDALRVVIVRDGESWFAQCLDIDYAAGGSTLEEAQNNFEEGLAATVMLHIHKFGNLNKLMKDPSPEAIEHLGMGKKFKFTMLTDIQSHDISEPLIAERLNRSQIAYGLKEAA